MPTYQYIAKDRAGAEYRGTYEDIGDITSLRAELSRLGYVLIEASRAQAPSRLRGRITQQDVVAFAYKLAGMYSAGLSVIQCLETLETQSEKPALRGVIADIKERLQGGASLRKAFEPHKQVFSEFFVGMLEAGEAGGKLADSLEMSAVYLEKKAELRNKIRSAFVYPVSVGVVCLGILACLLVFVVPVFIKLYDRLHVLLPWPTLLLVNLSGMLRGWGGLVVLSGIGFGIWLAKGRLRDAETRRRWDRLKLEIPVLGRLNRLILVTRFVRPFAMLISVGLSVIDALRIAGRVSGNEEMTQISEALQKSARAGNPVGRSLEAHPIFPPVIVQMAVSGEQVGRLAEMLGKGADILDRDIDRMIGALIVKLEPALTLVMGLVIGLVLLGVYLPMFDYMTQVS
ncbi:MAG: type II secretion system F family protein [Sedimentisphaerales bacterium]|nr:type II secretion system F family protein [Sedimentisphaerales bacterium]